jgi:hypothetical protein
MGGCIDPEMSAAPGDPRVAEQPARSRPCLARSAVRSWSCRANRPGQEREGVAVSSSTRLQPSQGPKTPVPGCRRVVGGRDDDGGRVEPGWPEPDRDGRR